MGAGTSTGDAARPGRDAREAPERAVAAAAAVPVPEVSEVVPEVSGGSGGSGAAAPDPAAGPVDTKRTSVETRRAVLDAPDPADAQDADARHTVPDDVKTEVRTDGADGVDGVDTVEGAEGDESEETSQRFSAVTRYTARPEGGGRAAPGDAPAPARQWPLLSVLGTTGLGLLIVGLHPFAEAFRIGTILIGLALVGGAVLRRVMPSVGMLAVRSRFTDMVTYGLLGVVIVMLSLMTQPKPWLEIPFLEDIVHSTVP
ncbi:DUF3017 domain-containing protein [Streptomyces lushanensis]|uniref:DUF3017 domain-containing protein n=1 Tax=Streptomyces lushanensis TaxID=1434255 RepID=UPI00083601A7|nr:DUF3017 domain-containing protein [Streptomyces lushanensis]